MPLNLEVILVCVILYLQQNKEFKMSQKNRKILLFIHEINKITIY
jgi:hypothetical protein